MSAVSFAALAVRLDVSERTLRRLLQEGWLARYGVQELPRRPRGARRFTAASVERLLTHGIDGLRHARVRRG